MSERTPSLGDWLVAAAVISAVSLSTFLIGYYEGKRIMKARAIEAGVAKWELESQENPTAKFVWLPSKGGEE
jgi:hypothetical protein